MKLTNIKKLQKEIERSKTNYTNNEDVIIKVKAENEDQIFSPFNYDNKEELTSELASFLINNAKIAPKKQQLHIQIHCNDEISESETKNAIQSHFGREFLDTQYALKKNSRFSFACLLLGIISLAFLLVLNRVFDSYILITITDIVAWVFIWESADAFFLQRAELKSKAFTLLRLYSAKISVINQNIKKEQL